MRIGFGYDVHQLVSGRSLILGGVKLAHEKGLLGHSDADALVHAIVDAILGALALGTIGDMFPDTDPSYKDMDSLIMLEAVVRLVQHEGYRIGNVDAMVVMEAPKISPYVMRIRETLAKYLLVSPGQVSVKGTRSEKMGFVGREEGVAVHAVVLLVAHLE